MDYNCPLGKQTRKWHVVIHNQGAYDSTGKVKDDLLKSIQLSYPGLQGYIIAQEENTTPRNGDTHLQCNFYFKSSISKKSLLKSLQRLYPEIRDELNRLVGRIQIIDIKGNPNDRAARAMDNYLQSKVKDGADPKPLSDLLNRGFDFDKWISFELKKEINITLDMLKNLNRYKDLNINEYTSPQWSDIHEDLM